MLQLKKLFHLKYYIIFSIKINNILNSIYIKKKSIYLFLILILINFIFKNLKKKKYFYVINTKILNLKILNSKIINFFNFFNNIKVLNTTLQFNLISKKKKNYTILRSPFVHKISREQFVFDIINGILYISFNNIDIYYIYYWELLLKKNIFIFFSFNLLVKRIIY